MGIRSAVIVGSLALSCSSADASRAGAPHDAWSSRRSEPVARFEAAAASDGARIYFLGGITGVDGDFASAMPSRRVDIYDPESDTWSDGPPLPAEAPKHHLAIATIGSRIYVLGGFDGILNQRPNEPFLPIARAYVLDGGAWRRLADPPLARGAATAQAIDGKIYVTGGAPTEGQDAYAELDVYDPATDAWTTAAPMPTPREHLASCAVFGRMIAVGGWFRDKATHAAESYDPSTNTWTRLADMPTARGGLGAVELDGTCHVIGGEDWALPAPGTFATHEAVDPKSGGWRVLAPMPLARHGFGLARQAMRAGEALFAIGGGPSHGNSYTDVVTMYTP